MKKKNYKTTSTDDVHWNYRVFRYTDGSVGLHEAYYIKNKVTSWTELPMFVADTKEELLEIIKVMEQDIKRFKKILKYKK